MDRGTARTIVGIVGNPKARSRTYQAVSEVAERLAASTSAKVASIIDLIDLHDELFTFGAPRVQTALEHVRAADLLVIGSPVYKASYTGLLKAFCDHIAAAELAGKLGVLVMLGGAPQHALVVEVHLRPLLIELGATCATPGLYVLENDMERITDIAAEYVARVVRHWPRLPGAD